MIFFFACLAGARQGSRHLGCLNEYNKQCSLPSRADIQIGGTEDK